MEVHGIHPNQESYLDLYLRDNFVNENDTSWGCMGMAEYLWVKVARGSGQSNHDPLDGQDSHSNGSQYSLHSCLSDCGVTSWQKELKRPTSIIVGELSSRW
jgi:hypothetical protein